MRLTGKQIREADLYDLDIPMRKVKRKPIYFILEDIYDTYNVGGLFRLADALAVSKIYICGQMETPPNPRIKRASIGTYKVVPWEYKSSSAAAIAELRNSKFKIQNSKFQIVGVEQAKGSKPYTEIEYKMPVALILGNETSGVRPETLKLCDEIAEIPMFGINKSLNVIVSAGIVGYWIVNQAAG